MNYRPPNRLDRQPCHVGIPTCAATEPGPFHKDIRCKTLDVFIHMHEKGERRTLYDRAADFHTIQLSHKYFDGYSRFSMREGGMS